MVQILGTRPSSCVSPTLTNRIVWLGDLLRLLPDLHDSLFKNDLRNSRFKNWQPLRSLKNASADLEALYNLKITKSALGD